MKVPLAKDRKGLKTSIEGLLTRVGHILKRSGADDGGYEFVLKEEILPHLKHTATSFYSGQIEAVDDFFQLYGLDAGRAKAKEANAEEGAELTTQKALLQRERHCIVNAHALLHKKYRGVPLWALVKDLFGHGSTVSGEICELHGFNPHQEAGNRILQTLPKKEEV